METGGLQSFEATFLHTVLQMQIFAEKKHLKETHKTKKKNTHPRQVHSKSIYKLTVVAVKAMSNFKPHTPVIYLGMHHCLHKHCLLENTSTLQNDIMWPESYISPT